MKRLFLSVVAASLVLAYLPPHSARATVGSVTVTIQNADGTVYSGAAMVVQFMPIDPLQFDNNFSLATGQSLGTGGMTTNDFPTLANGYHPLKALQYKVSITYQHHQVVSTATYGEVLPPPQDVDVRTPGDYTLTFRLLAPNKRIHGTITDELGVPIGADPAHPNDHIVWVNVGRDGAAGYTYNNGRTVGYFPNDWIVVRTDTAGRYVANVSDSGGSFSLGANHTDQKKYMRSLEKKTASFSADTSVEDREVNFVLYRAGSTTVNGRVLDRNGKPLDPLKYFIQVNAFMPSNTTTWSNARVGADGRFSLKLTPGTFTISIGARNPVGNNDKWVEYEQKSVTLVDGQTLDIGDQYPNREYTINDKKINAPEIIVYQNNQRLLLQATPTLAAKYGISFNTDVPYKDLLTHVRTTWQKGVVIISADTVSASSTTASPTQSYIVSKPVTPKNINIKSVTLIALQETTGGASAQYDISPDGRTWLTVVPGQVTLIPGTWNTRNGLSWRATMQRGSTGSQVKISDVQIKYTYVPVNPKPKVTAVKVKRRSNISTLTITGKNLSKYAEVYVGGRRVPKTLRAKGGFDVAVKLKDYRAGKYQVTVVNSDLQLSVAKGINIFSTTR